MSCCAGILGDDIRLNQFHRHTAPDPAGNIRKIVRLSAVALAGAWLAGCVQTSQVAHNVPAPTVSRQASLTHYRVASLPLRRRVAAARRHSPYVLPKHAAAKPGATQGIASFYWEGTQTASGEKFDATQLTAAHPTLPFGTRLRVTNVTNGQSVTVRVNDRGPYVPGRIVDVSHSAAGALGMIDGGLAKVKLDVVE